jgi:polysaccharide biosynthesis protein PslA
MHEAGIEYVRAADGVLAPCFRVAKGTLRVRLNLLLMALDGGAILLGFALAGKLNPSGGPNAFNADLAWLLVPIFTLCAFSMRAYGFNVLASRSYSIKRAVVALGVSVLIAFAIVFYLHIGERLSRVELSIGALITALLMMIERCAFDRLVRHAMPDGPTNKLILCEGVTRTPSRGEIVVNVEEAGIEPRLDDPVMLDRLGCFARNADRVIIACPVQRRAIWSRTLKGMGVDTEILMPELAPLGALGFDRFEHIPTAVVAQGPLCARDRMLKRSFDIALALAALLLLAPLLLLVGLLVKLEDGGPIFFRQNRIGEGNRLFTMYKFRTMRAETQDGDGVRSASRDDERITRIGHFLRASSVDELPQFYNVLRGEMSIVGPRPHALRSTVGTSLFWEVDDRYWNRHAAKPGLTGLAQIRGFRGATALPSDLTGRVQADLEYLRGWTLWQDIKIVLATVRVLRHRNAF